MSESDTAPHAFDEHALRPYTGGGNPTAIEMDVNVQRTTEYPEGTVFETLKLKKDTLAGELRDADSYCLIKGRTLGDHITTYNGIKGSRPKLFAMGDRIMQYTTVNEKVEGGAKIAGRQLELERMRWALARRNRNFTIDQEIEEPTDEQLAAINETTTGRVAVAPATKAMVKGCLFHNYKITEPIKNAYGPAWSALVLKQNQVAELLSLGAEPLPKRPEYTTRTEAIAEHGVSLGWVCGVGDAGDDDDEKEDALSADQLEALDKVYVAWRLVSIAIATTNNNFVTFDKANTSDDYEHLALCGLKQSTGKVVSLGGEALSPWAQTLFNFKAVQVKSVMQGLHEATMAALGVAGAKRRATSAPTTAARPSKTARSCSKCDTVLAAAEEAESAHQEKIEGMRALLSQITMPTKGSMEALCEPFLEISAFPGTEAGDMQARITLQMAKWVNAVVLLLSPPSQGAGGSSADA
jgi:hypothetical protein